MSEDKKVKKCNHCIVKAPDSDGSRMSIKEIVFFVCIAILTANGIVSILYELFGR